MKAQVSHGAANSTGFMTPPPGKGGRNGDRRMSLGLDHCARARRQGGARPTCHDEPQYWTGGNAGDMNSLDHRFSIAPMMEWTDSAIFSNG
jgi:hypothetical protein